MEEKQKHKKRWKIGNSKKKEQKREKENCTQRWGAKRNIKDEMK